MVAEDSLFEHFLEGTGLDDVLGGAGLDFVVEELAEKFEGDVALGQVFDFGQELFGEY